MNDGKKATQFPPCFPRGTFNQSFINNNSDSYATYVTLFSPKLFSLKMFRFTYVFENITSARHSVNIETNYLVYMLLYIV